MKTLLKTTFVLAFVYYQCGYLFAEERSKTLLLIQNNLSSINEYCTLFNVNPGIIQSIIFAERTLNYTIEDEIFDLSMAKMGVDRSIGLTQIKVSTAFWIERQLYSDGGFFFLGADKQRLISKSKTREILCAKLMNDSTAILYAVAYIAMIKKRWIELGFTFTPKNESGILATLYSLGIYNAKTSKIREPRSKTKVNYFGSIAQKYFDEMNT